MVRLQILEHMLRAGGRPPDFYFRNQGRLPESDFLAQGRTAEAPSRVHGLVDRSLSFRTLYRDLDPRADRRPIGLHADQLELQPAVSMTGILEQRVIINVALIRPADR